MKKLFLLLVGTTLLMLSACGDPYVSVAAQENVDAHDLKVFCESKKLVTEETKKADELYAKGKTALSNENSQMAYTSLGQATALYRMAIAKYWQKKANGKIAKLEADLKKDQESLKGYQELLSSINHAPATDTSTQEAPNAN